MISSVAQYSSASHNHLCMFFIGMHDQYLSERCYPLPWIPHSSPSAYTSLYGTTVDITCDEGYRFEDGLKTKQMICQPDKQWYPWLKCRSKPDSFL